ncbi:ATP-binding protein [Catellatospora sp. KI3]|uniref:sensor histidine kinase n=1 Tax=Catellatospora sp. KI3 TaxID=3041620 RepID=UPI002482160A|nr:ATP-binding protein [Catellatospora sp. KI3]MDI1460552.1 ATP-binding protein [Catellatospora sp. KI3]
MTAATDPTNEEAHLETVDMLLHLSRRSQAMVDRLIGCLDRMGQQEQDPERLKNFFELDFLALRMRRNDESLLVLAGGESARIRREPVSLEDVLQGACSEVEDFRRIEFGVVEPGLVVAAPVVNDLVHLLAELYDNAAAFSAPDTKVLVEVRRVTDRAVILIEDRGIGIPPARLRELNQRLAQPSAQVGAVTVRQMGIGVVGRLAQRHDIRVELEPAGERGIAASVVLPAHALVG